MHSLERMTSLGFHENQDIIHRAEAGEDSHPWPPLLRHGRWSRRRGAADRSLAVRLPVLAPTMSMEIALVASFEYPHSRRSHASATRQEFTRPRIWWLPGAEQFTAGKSEQGGPTRNQNNWRDRKKLSLSFVLVQSLPGLSSPPHQIDASEGISCCERGRRLFDTHLLRSTLFRDPGCGAFAASFVAFSAWAHPVASVRPRSPIHTFHRQGPRQISTAKKSPAAEVLSIYEVQRIFMQFQFARSVA